MIGYFPVLLMSPVSIIIPAFNEEEGIGGVLERIRTLSLQAEIIVVDDGSTDKTAEVAAAAGARVMRNPMNRGYGFSLKHGMMHATHDTIVITDADGTYPIEEIPLLLTAFEKGFDMVVGARQGKAYKGSLLKIPARWIFKFLVEFTTGSKIPDINSGMRVFRKKDLMPYFPDICNGFSFTTTSTLIYMLTGKMVHYVLIPYDYRVGTSKVKMIRDSLRTLQYITEAIVHYNPMKIFLVLSCVVFFAGIVFTFVIGWYAFFQGIVWALVIFGLGLLAEAQRKREVAH